MALLTRFASFGILVYLGANRVQTSSYISTITLSLFFFNLLPLPYLDGAEVLSALLDRLPTRPSEDYDLESTDGISQPRNDRRWKQRVEKLTASVTAFLAGSVLLASVWKEIGRG
jgi:S2P endopeptidase